MNRNILYSIHRVTFALVLLFTGIGLNGQQLVAYWNFNEGANGTPWNAPIASSAGAGTITAGTWTWGDINYTDGFSGSLQNALFGDPSGASLSLKGDVMNGNYIQFEFSLSGLESLEISYWTRKTSTGFSNNQWSWSSDGVNFTDFGDPVNPTPNSSGEVITLSAPAGLNGAASAYLRYTLDGASSATGNNRIDNLQLNAIEPGAVLPPSNLDAQAVSTTQINLTWELNSNNDNVLLAWSADGTFGEPAGNYNVGDPIAGGGTVLYFGTGTSSDHTSLNAGTTYYYKAWSKSGSEYSIGVTASETTFPDPAVTALPYTEPFDEDLGICYIYSVSGDSKTWIWSTYENNGMASINGYNSGDVEEDWLILPAVNFNEYVDEVLTFESWWRYGIDDDNNYLKLFYSADYFGTGDPSAASWIELSFTRPTVEQTWTGSGDIDLSAINGEQVYIGLKYRYEPGNYRWWEVDNFSISGIPVGSNATKLSVSSVNNGNPPSVNTPFPVTVTALDNNNVPAAVANDTQVTLSLATGTGTLGGTLTGMIPAGQINVEIPGVTYNIAETGVAITASASGLSSGTSEPFEVLTAADHLAFVGVPGYGQINTPVATFIVEARRSDNSVDLNFTGNITLSKVSGSGNMTGTLTREAVAGVAEFDDVQFDAIGSYTIQASANGLSGAVSSAIIILGVPQLESLLLPKYMQGVNGSNETRVPYAFRVTLENLQPGATYRYINQVVTYADSPTTNGAGNAVFVVQNGDFYRTASASFEDPGAYGEFTTDGNGSYSGWFISEPTGNARFTPGNYVKMRIRLNDGQGGTTAEHYLTTADSALVINYGIEADPMMGTGIRCISLATPKSFAFIYDNESGTGRPVYGTSIETTGVDFTQIPQYAQFYKDDVSGFDGAWGGIVPNVNAQGIKLIQVRSLNDGSIIGENVSSNGIWGDANTVNPSGGLENVLVINLIEDPVVFVNPSSLSGFTYVYGEGPSDIQTYNVTGQNLPGSGFIDVNAPTHFEISLDGQSFTNEFQLEYLNGNLVNEPVMVYVRLKAGLEIGNYFLEIIAHTASIINQVNVVCNGSVTAPIVPPVITSSLLPQYIQGVNGTNNNRVPYAFRITMSDLQPNATYKYINQVVNYADSPTTNGAGNIIFVKQSGSFIRSTNPSFETPDNYGEFTADASGSYSGWFMTEPTGNARFTPGNYVKMRIRLNDGQGGTAVVHYLTSADSVKVIDFGTQADPTMGTGIMGLSFAEPKTFVFLYDNEGGNGRPVYGTNIEATGIDFSNISQYAAFYRDEVASIDGYWGGIVPNILPNGIRRVEERSLDNGNIYNSHTSTNGTWFNTNTINPSGGLDNILVIDLITAIESPEAENEITAYAASGQIIIKTTSVEQAVVQVYNVMGQPLIFREFSGSNLYSLTHSMKPGAYIVNIYQGNRLYNVKIIVR
ncbi:MAG: T9SS type A sorting domain-containing protein [Sphingobacteriia bacterium]|nr:T9SS type A sorting domain-containing protein [Sphingobacteriia bacterium]